MIRLDKSSWSLIHNALTYRLEDAISAGAQKQFIDHLQQVLRKIGDGGSRAFKKGVFTEDEKFTVILLIPASDGETFFTTVTAKSVSLAVERARHNARTWLRDPDLDPESLKVVGLFNGALKDLVGRWNRLNDQARPGGEGR